MKLRYMGKKHEAGEVWSFYFEPIDELTWIAGQSIRLELPRPTWGVDERRFTIASAPQEKQLQITTHISDSSFKQHLNGLREGDIVSGFAIEGDFVWGDEDTHRLLLAGGIGVTPFRAMISSRIALKLPINATLLYSSKVQPAPFDAELHEWSGIDPSLQIFHFDHRLTAEAKGSLMPQWQDSLVYISGPSAMVDTLSSSLLTVGVDEEQLRRDWFTGYTEQIML